MQFLESSRVPLQSRPPFWGGGAMHSRLRQWAHSVLQADHLLHSVHAPSTVGAWGTAHAVTHAECSNAPTPTHAHYDNTGSPDMQAIGQHPPPRHRAGAPMGSGGVADRTRTHTRTHTHSLSPLSLRHSPEPSRGLKPKANTQKPKSRDKTRHAGDPQMGMHRVT